MDVNALSTELRGRLGDLTEDQLPSAQITRALAAALREFSKYRKMGTPTMLQISTEVYDYPLPVGTTAVTDLFAYPTWLFWQNVDPLNLSIQLPTLSTMGLMTLIGIKPIDLWPTDWTIIPPDATASPPTTLPTLRLYNLPDVPALLFLRVQRPLGYTELTDAECEMLMLFAKGECLEYLGLRRSKPVKRVPTAAGSLLLDDGKDLRADGRQCKQDFYAQIGRGATVLDAG
jgi:hypothetical protein